MTAPNDATERPDRSAGKFRVRRQSETPMERVEAAYRAGVAEAERAIAANGLSAPPARHCFGKVPRSRSAVCLTWWWAIRLPSSFTNPW